MKDERREKEKEGRLRFSDLPVHFTLIIHNPSHFSPFFLSPLIRQTICSLPSLSTTSSSSPETEREGLMSRPCICLIPRPMQEKKKKKKKAFLRWKTRPIELQIEPLIWVLALIKKLRFALPFSSTTQTGLLKALVMMAPKCNILSLRKG